MTIKIPLERAVPDAEADLQRRRTRAAKIALAAVSAVVLLLVLLAAAHALPALFPDDY